MAQGAVLPHAAHRVREGAGEEQVAEGLPGVGLHLGQGGALVAAVEGPQEVGPVLAVLGQQPGRLGQRAQHEPGPVRPSQAAGGQPGVRRDHVGGDEGVLQVEGHQLPVGGEHLAPQPVPAGVRVAPGRLGPGPAVLHHRRQVGPGDVGVPVDDPWVQAELPAFLVVHGRVQRQQVAHAVDGLALGVGAVQLHVGQGPVGLLPSFLQLGPPLCGPAPQRQRGHHPFRAAQHRGGPSELALHPAPAREGPVRHHDGLAVAVVEGVLGEPLRGSGPPGAGSAGGWRRRWPPARSWAGPAAGAGPRWR